jgi:hypothetical protein
MKNYKDLPEAPYQLVSQASEAALLRSIVDARLVNRHDFVFVVDTSEDDLTPEDLAQLAEWAGTSRDLVFISALDDTSVLVEITNSRFRFDGAFPPQASTDTVVDEVPLGPPVVCTLDPRNLPGVRDVDSEWAVFADFLRHVRVTEE